MDIRVLCLHGGGQTGRILRSQLYHLEERLAKNHHVELVYVESPISDWDMEKEVGEQSQGDIQISSSFEQLNLNSKTSSQPAEKMNPILDNKNDNLSFSKWYDDNPTPIASNQTAGETENNNKCHYIGMDASLLHLHQIWKRELYSRPYHGILAFHQGTVLANILLLSQKLENCEFVIFASGYTLNNPPPGRGCMGLPPEYFIDPELPFRIDSSSSTRSHSDIHTNIDNSNDEARKEITTSRKRNHNNMNSRDTTNEERLFNTGSQHIRSLHLIGKKCTRIHPEKSLRLALRFYNAQVYEHCFANDYSFPNRARDINVIGKFIIRCKKEMLSRSNIAMIQSTQAELALVTQEATDLVTSTVTSASYKKSKCLMAVIAPQTLGIPNSRNPTYGGGAPCPAEFLKKKSERGKDEDQSTDIVG